MDYARRPSAIGEKVAALFAANVQSRAALWDAVLELVDQVPGIIFQDAGAGGGGGVPQVKCNLFKGLVAQYENEMAACDLLQGVLGGDFTNLKKESAKKKSDAENDAKLHCAIAGGQSPE